MRIGSQHARGGSEIDEKISSGQIDQKACKAVVIAELQFADGYGVVFIDNGQHAPFQQFGKGIARIEEALTRAQVIAGQQHLSGGHAVRKKHLVPALHELPLPHCCRGLTRRKARGFNHMPARGKRGPTSGHSAGRNKHQTARLRAPRVTGCDIARRQQVAQTRQLPGQIFQHRHAQALGIGEYGAAYLDDHHPRLGKHPCAFLPPVFRRRCHICSTDRYSRV